MEVYYPKTNNNGLKKRLKCNAINKISPRLLKLNYNLNELTARNQRN